MAEIILENLSLDYPVFGLNTRSFKQSLLKISTGGLIASDANTVVIEALKSLSVHLQSGDKLALIGHNGAGKSTLLRVLAGIYLPSAGELTIKGSVAALLDISLGMQSEATGYENIYIRGLLMGLSRKEIAQLIPDIEAFTDLGKFLSIPIKTYSSGMRVRLAFAISTAIESEILLLDEAVGAGDASFADKAQQRIENLIRRSHIMVLASHDNELIKRFCNKGLWLEHGSVKAYGDIDTVVSAYENSFK